MNFIRNPDEQSQHWNQQHPPIGNRLKQINPEATIRNPEASEAWMVRQRAGYLEIENNDRNIEGYIETLTTNEKNQDNVVKMAVGGKGNQFPRLKSFRNPAKRQRQLDNKREHNIKRDTWINDKYQGQFLDKLPGTVFRDDSGKIHEGGPWTRRQKVKRVTGGEHPVKRVTGGMPAVCVPVKKKVYKCRTIKYRGRGITYCWYEDEEDCYSLD